MDFNWYALVDMAQRYQFKYIIISCKRFVPYMAEYVKELTTWQEDLLHTVEDGGREGKRTSRSSLNWGPH